MICFHHNDADGRCAGAIVHKKYPECRFVEMEYSKAVPFDMIGKDEEVWIVDFSFKPKDMEKLMEITGLIYWIDHHKTILDHPFNHLDAGIAGCRSMNHSGAYLTWQFIYPGKLVPWAVELISDYDTWTLNLPSSKSFRFGLNIIPHQPTDSVWDNLLGNGEPFEESVHYICGDGEVVLRFIHQFGQDYIKSYGFETEFEGYKCIAQGVYNFGSDFYGDLINEYDICLNFEFLGDKWIVGLYSVKVDVSEIAKKYGGGGHKGAAGFVCDELPFKKTI